MSTTPRASRAWFEEEPIRLNRQLIRPPIDLHPTAKFCVKAMIRDEPWAAAHLPHGEWNTHEHAKNTTERSLVATAMLYLRLLASLIKDRIDLFHQRNSGVSEVVYRARCQHLDACILEHLRRAETFHEIALQMYPDWIKPDYQELIRSAEARVPTSMQGVIM